MLFSLIVIAVLFAITGCTKGAVGALIFLGLYEAIAFLLRRA